MMRDRLADDEEWGCLRCGNVEYGAGFEAIANVKTEPRGRYGRGARHGGARL